MSSKFQATLKDPRTQSYLQVMRNYSMLQHDWKERNFSDLFPDKWREAAREFSDNITDEIFPLKNTDLVKNSSLANDTRHINKSMHYTGKALDYLLIDSNGNNILLREMKKIDYVAKAWEAILAPMNLDLFMGFPNETMLMHFLSNSTGLRKKRGIVLAGILFDNIGPNGSLPKHVHYRIRQDSRVMHNTHEVRSRYWYPGPLAGNSRYYYYGFVWIQDQIERAIVDIHTGRNVTAPGVYIQEIPYPCYLKDQ